MRTKFTNSELSHIWANQTQSHGKGSNMFFEHETIYSYGYHFKIAQYVKNKDNVKCIFLNQRSYSNSTNKQQSLVFRAIPPTIPFFRVVSFFNDIDAASTAHKENLTAYINEAERLQGLTIRANKLKMGYLSQLKGQIDIFEKYALFFGFTDLAIFNPISGQGLTIKERYELINSFIWGYENSEELKKWQEKQEQNTRKAIEKAKEKAKEQIENFRQFKISSIYANLGHYLLRYNKDSQMVETSGGVKIHGLIFIKAYNRLISGELKQGQHVGDFTYNGIDGEIVSVGCHKIPMAEIKNIVAVL
jgi:hypothetical protein